MSEHVLRMRMHLSLPRPQVFQFFSDAANLAKITPPELDFSILTEMPMQMKVGALIDYRIGLHGIPMRWRTRISRWVENEEFEDEQLKGPYALWLHRHRFSDDGAGGTFIEDEVRYRLPLGPLGDLVHFIVRRQLNRIFSYRETRVRELLTG